MATPKTWVEAPARQPRKNTILDTIPVHQVENGPYIGIEYVADPCTWPDLVAQNCFINIGNPEGTVKAFGGVGNEIETGVFGVYAGIDCYLSGDTDGEFQEIARRVLENGEYHAVEGVVAGSIAGFATSIGTSSSIVTALGLLEDALANNVPGQGYIWMTPAQATWAVSENLLVRNLDGTLETMLGTPVIVYTNPTSSASIFATGPTNIWRTGVKVTQGAALTYNRTRVLAERLYTYAVECGAWRVALTMPTGGQTPTPMPLTMILGTIPASPIPVGTDTTAGVTTSVAPTDEVYLWYKVNGGTAISLGEMTETGTLSFVMNIAGGSLGLSPGDEVEAWAETTYDSASVESNHIIIEVIA